MNKILLFFFYIALSIFLTWCTQFFSKENNQQSNTWDNSIDHANFVAHVDSNANVIFRYPSKAKVSHESGRAKVTYIWPDSKKNTEITDGYTFYAYTKEKKGRDIENFVQNKYNNISNIQEKIESPEEFRIDWKKAYKYKIKSGLWTETIYNIFESNWYFIIVSYFVADPNSLWYIEDIKNIRKTLEVEEN